MNVQDLKSAPVLKSFSVKEQDTDEICPVCKKAFKKDEVIYASIIEKEFVQMHQTCFDQLEEEFYIKNKLYPDLQEQ